MLSHNPELTSSFSISYCKITLQVSEIMGKRGGKQEAIKKKKKKKVGLEWKPELYFLTM